MTMKTVNVSELKTHLSRYLRMAARGTRIVVTDRDDPLHRSVRPTPPPRCRGGSVCRAKGGFA